MARSNDTMPYLADDEYSTDGMFDILAISETILHTQPGNPSNRNDYIACILRDIPPGCKVMVEGPNGEDRETFKVVQ